MVGKRLVGVATLALVALVLFVGCGPTDSVRRNHGWATVRFDGTPLGDGNSSYPRIECSRDSNAGGATLIERHDRWFGPDAGGDWIPRGGGPKASLRLEMTLGQETAASIEFSIGDSVYRSAKATQVEPGWSDGRAVFRDVPLASGAPYEGKSTLKRLVVEWRCVTT
jgi:hypothetical protein